MLGSRDFAFALAMALVASAILLHPGEGNAQTPSPIVGRLVDDVQLRGVEDVHLDGDYAFLPCREGKRLTICSIADPTCPAVVSSFTHAELESAAGLAINGEVAYLTSQGNHRLLVLDVADKTAPRLLGSVSVGSPDVKGVLYKVAYRDGYCYVAHQAEKKLFVVDVRDPQKPFVIADAVVTTDDDGPFSILVRGDHALVGTLFGRRNRLAVVDIAEPTQPQLVAQVFDPAISQLSGDVVDDLYFCVAWDRNAFLVFDVRDAGDPKLIATLIDERLGEPNRCVVSGDRAYLPMVKGDGVAVVDVADPMKPKFVRAFRDPVMKKTYGAAVRDHWLFVGSREGNSLVVIDRRRLDE
ncbi:MAG: hypothetical protein WEB58_07210 [Planctomycetaceae bacterium]